VLGNGETIFSKLFKASLGDVLGISPPEKKKKKVCGGVCVCVCVCTHTHTHICIENKHTAIIQRLSK